MFYYADEFNLSWLPTLRAMWSPKGQQVMIKTPGHQQTYYGIGAVNYYTGETVVQFQPHKRRQEMAHLLEAVRHRPHSLGQPYSMWTLQRLATYLAAQTGIQVSDETIRRLLKAHEIVFSRPQHTISSPDPEYTLKKRRLKRPVTG